MLRLDEITCSSPLFNFILSERLSNSPLELEVLLFSEFKNIVSIWYYNFIELNILW